MFFLKKSLICACLLTSFSCLSAGMVPDTSLLLINEEDQGGSMDVKNTDADAQLLYTKIINLPDDPKPELLVTQPVVRVEAGKTQRVRFVLKNSAEPLKVEHLKRVVFTTVPQMDKNKVKVVFSQNLPVIIHPVGLEMNIEPWKALRWHIANDHLIVENKTPYVVRLEQTVKLLPSGKMVNLPKAYIIPGETLNTSSTQKLSALDKQLEIYPATRYGYKAKNFVAEIQ